MKSNICAKQSFVCSSLLGLVTGNLLVVNPLKNEGNAFYETNFENSKDAFSCANELVVFSDECLLLKDLNCFKDNVGRNMTWTIRQGKDQKTLIITPQLLEKIPFSSQHTKAICVVDPVEAKDKFERLELHLKDKRKTLRQNRTRSLLDDVSYLDAKTVALNLAANPQLMKDSRMLIYSSSQPDVRHHGFLMIDPQLKNLRPIDPIAKIEHLINSTTSTLPTTTTNPITADTVLPVPAVPSGFPAKIAGTVHKKPSKSPVPEYGPAATSIPIYTVPVKKLDKSSNVRTDSSSNSSGVSSNSISSNKACSTASALPGVTKPKPAILTAKPKTAAKLGDGSSNKNPTAGIGRASRAADGNSPVAAADLVAAAAVDTKSFNPTLDIQGYMLPKELLPLYSNINGEPPVDAVLLPVVKMLDQPPHHIINRVEVSDHIYEELPCGLADNNNPHDNNNNNNNNNNNSNKKKKNVWKNKRSSTPVDNAVAALVAADNVKRMNFVHSFLKRFSLKRQPPVVLSVAPVARGAAATPLVTIVGKPFEATLGGYANVGLDLKF